MIEILIIVIVVSVFTVTVLAVKLRNKNEQEQYPIAQPSYPPPPRSTPVMPKQKPIDKVIEFINMNMENSGYENAKSNSNETFENEKITELRERGKQICRLAIIEYNEKIAEIDAAMDECHKTGLLNTEEKLKSQKKIYQEQYIKEIENINSELENDEKFKEKTVFSSYRRGFAKWRRAIAEGLIVDDEVNNGSNNKD